ncbi:MAG: hypothetical protein RUMPE_01159 [Eubacteriales bacterium SKADARSKE-1]|nr:hypothetical protein [Eubacteriales bacterium SKADARSKE-1]
MKNISEISIKEKLILAGIDEIEKNGIQGFSLRKVASKCGVSCAAPYKHFANKTELITEIIKYINEKWYIRQKKIVEAYDGNLRHQLTEISLEYIRFLVENPHFRSIIMLKDKKMDPQHVQMKSELSLCTKNLIKKYCKSVGMPQKAELIKTFIIRSFIYGAALMFDNGELEYNPENFELIARTIDREFDLK